MHQKAFEMLDNGINKNDNVGKKEEKKKKDDNINNNISNMRKKSKKSMRKSNKDKSIFSEKIQYKTYENVNSSINELIDTELLEEEPHNSDGRKNANNIRNNILSNNSRSFFDKNSMITQSNSQ